MQAFLCVFLNFSLNIKANNANYKTINRTGEKYKENMKKAIIIICTAVSVICGVLIAEYMINSDFKDVDTTTVSTSTVEDFIELTGEVKEVNKRELKYDFPVGISKLYVDIGSKVEAGARLADFDKSSLLNKFEIAKLNSSDSKSFENVIASLKSAPESLYSPIKGVVSEVYCKEGADIFSDKPLIVITDTENLVVRAKVSSDSFSEIYLGQKALIYSDEYAVPGEVSKIYPTATKSESDGLSWISFEITPEESKNLKCGTAVDLKVCSATYENVVIIPFDSVMFDEEYPYVYVNVSGYAVKKRVVLGKEFDTSVEIKSGLSVDDKLVMSPKKYNIKNGDKLSDGE